MRSLAALAIILPLMAFAPCAHAADQAAVADGKTIKLNYTLSVDGKVVDTTKDKEPIEYVQGKHTLLPGLEQKLEGMKAGEHRHIELAPDQGFGQVHPEAVIEVPKERMPEGKIEVGTVLATQGPDGNPMKAVIKEIKDKSVVLDFNHPLAGKTLQFDIDVVSIS